MRAVVQRVTQASVTVREETIGCIGRGLLVLLGVGQQDTTAQARWLADKVSGLRIFDDVTGQMNLGLAEVNGAMLVVSQFTLYGDCHKGRRPSFVAAAPPEKALPLYDEFVQAIRELGIEVKTGAFGAAMQVELVNEGPVTLIIDSD